MKIKLNAYNLKKTSLTNITYLIPYTIWMALSILSLTFFYLNISSYINTLTGMCLLMLLCRELVLIKNTATCKAAAQFLVILILLFSMWFTYRKMAIGLIFIYCARNTDLKILLKWTLKILIISLLSIAICSKIGMITNYERVTTDGRKREYLGFLYALYPSQILLNIVMIEVYLKRSKIKWITLVVLSIAAYYIYDMTDSRLAAFSTMILLILAFLLKANKRDADNVRFPKGMRILSLIFIACCWTSIYFTVHFNAGNIKYQLLNELLGKRLAYGQAAIKEYGIGILGSRINMVGSGLTGAGTKASGTYNYVDSLYIQIALRYGALAFIIIMLAMTILMKKIINDGDLLLVVLFSSFALHGIMDDLILYPYYNSILLLVCPILQNRTYLSTKT